MIWIKSQEQAIPHFNGSVVTIGNFDGVHLGHRKLLKELIGESRKNLVSSIVCTFRPHPRSVLKPKEPHHRLFDYRDQFDVMSQLGVDFLIEEKFSKDFSMMSADEFLTSYVQKMFNPVHIVVGYDFNFGKSRVGNIEYVRSYCSEKNIGFTVVDAHQVQGQVVSTTKIRQFLESGNLQGAADFLGRPYYLRGPVRVGYRRGRTIGVPTANISPEIEFVPRKGVYFTWAILNEVRYPSITNIGFNPTFDNLDSYLKVETHIFDFDQDIYGEHLKVELVEFVRDEKKFADVGELKQQIAVDLKFAREFFKI